jgi:hypothetical protein
MAQYDPVGMRAHKNTPSIIRANVVRDAFSLSSRDWNRAVHARTKSIVGEQPGCGPGAAMAVWRNPEPTTYDSLFCTSQNASISHAAMNATPPSGVTAPRMRMPVMAST